MNFLSIDVSLSPSKNILSATTLPTFTLSLWGNLLAYFISTNIILINTDSFRTSHDKASDDECIHTTWWFFWDPPTRTCIQIWSSTNMKWAYCAFHLSIHSQNHVPLVVSKLFSPSTSRTTKKDPKFLQLALETSVVHIIPYKCVRQHTLNKTHIPLWPKPTNTTRISIIIEKKKSEKTVGSAFQYWTPISRPENNTDTWIGTSGI